MMKKPRHDMLFKLRCQLVAITMLMVSSVVIAALSSTYLSSAANEAQATHDALTRGLAGQIVLKQTDAPKKSSAMNMVVIDYNAAGDITQLSSNYIIEDETYLLDAAQAARISDKDNDKDATIAWAKKTTPTGVRIALIDISARKAALNRQLTTVIIAGLISISTLFVITWVLSDWAIKPIRAAWDRQRQFVSDASHELKTPLAVIMANGEILSQDATIPEAASKRIAANFMETKRMKKLVEDLLILARADEEAAGTSAGLVRDAIDLSDLVSLDALEFEAVAFDRGCTIETAIAEHVFITGDKDQLDRAIRTLIDNATKYAYPHTPVSITLSCTNTKAVLKVQNKSDIISEKDLEHLFDRFYRTDAARSSKGSGGYGLGLAIAKSIVESHGGKISVISNENVGTMFTIVIPHATINNS